MAFYVNGQPVSQLNDSDYDRGELGLYVETFDSPKAHIHFRSLVIRKPDNIPGQAASTPTPMCQVVSNTLNLRRGPSIAYQPVLAVLNRGNQLEPLGRSPDLWWVRVRVHDSGEEGWVSALEIYISCDVRIFALPVSEPPPLSTRSAP